MTDGRDQTTHVQGFEDRQDRRPVPYGGFALTATAKRSSESSHSTRKTDAITLLKQREGAIANGEPVTSKISRFVFAEAAADLLTEYRINNRRSIDEVARRIRKHLEPFFGFAA